MTVEKEKKPTRQYKMFKKRVAKLNIFEESITTQNRVWNTLETRKQGYKVKKDINSSQKTVNYISVNASTATKKNTNESINSQQKSVKPMETIENIQPAVLQSNNPKKDYLKTNINEIIPNQPNNGGTITETENNNNIIPNNPQQIDPIQVPLTTDEINIISNSYEYTPFTETSAFKKIKNTSIEYELENIITEAIQKPSTTNSKTIDDIDPELLNLIKKTLIQSDVDIFNNGNENISETPINNSNFVENQIHNTFNKNFELRKQSYGKIAETFEKQIHPPVFNKQINQDETIDLTEKNANVINVDSLTFTSDTSLLEDDSSIALKKEELRSQVKNLIKETVNNNPSKNTTRNDLQELERQFKQSLERLKIAKKEN